MIKHYKGILGEFDYDDEEYEVFTDSNHEDHICHISDTPKKNMFSNMKIPNFEDLGISHDGKLFDKSHIEQSAVNTKNMFSNMKIPNLKNFNIRDGELIEKN